MQSDGANPAMTVPSQFNFTRDVVEKWSHKSPEALALWWINDSGAEQRFTFAQIARDARKAACLFAECGIQKADRVLIILPRLPQWWTAMLGLTRLGAIPIPGTTLLTPRDIAYRIEPGGVHAIITDAEGAAKVDNSFGGIRILIAADQTGWIPFDTAVVKANENFDPPPTLAADPGIIYFTSGTTGHPKMVLHTQVSYGLAHRATGELWLDLNPADVHWNLSDTGWAKAAWSSFFAPWHMGSCVFVTDFRGKFSAPATLDTLQQFPITTCCAPPTALRMMIREDLAKWKFPTLRHFVSAGEPLNPEVIETWKAATGLTIYEGYGQTESIVMIANVRSCGRQLRIGSMGHPLPGFDIEILDHDLNPQPANTPGEVAVRIRPHRPLGLFQEYWNNPEENAARFRGDFYLTGDVAQRDDQGYHWFVGRADDVIKSAGYRIGPFEVESALIEHPSVMEAAVVGVPDEVRGQIVKAFIVLRKTARASDELKVELQDHCKRITAPYKYPREIEFVEELPKTISGKIRRVQLRSSA